MAAFDTIRTRDSLDLSHGIQNMISAVIAWNDARVTRKSLAGLSDRELDDIGLHRGDIEAIATGNRY